MADPWEHPPAWATGPDCFESEQHRERVMFQWWLRTDGRMPAYQWGHLSALADAIEEFQSYHRLLLNPELTRLHTDLVRLMAWCEDQIRTAEARCPGARQRH